jgi:hypothetical protein
LVLGIKWLEGETDHSSPSRAEDKNAMSYKAMPSYFMLWWLIKHRGNFNNVFLRPSFLVVECKVANIL